VLRVESGASHIPSMYPTTELHDQLESPLF
jgi:hypothetical protein